ncbi:MAG: type VI secretion system baseplate subunit TssE [bacterium]
MRERSLLERLRDRRSDAERSPSVNTALMTESVLAHLRDLLNSRQGISITVPDYGIPDLTDLVHSFPEAIALMRREIRASIERYEPRLRNVAITHVPDADDPFHLNFEIRGELVTERDKTPVSFRTTLDATGRANIRR